MSFSYKGITKPYITKIRKRKPYWAPRRRRLLYVPVMAGSHLEGTDIDPIVIPVDIWIKGESPSDLELKADDFVEWLDSNKPEPLVFGSQPDRTYYAVVDGDLIPDEIVNHAFLTVCFLCPDPYSFGPELTATFASDIVSLTNQGLYEADPIFEFEVLQPVTFAMIQNQNNEYQLIGTPADDDVEVVDSKVLVLDERGETLSTWGTTPIKVDDNFIDVDGAMDYDGTGIFATSYGVGEKMHGPAVIKEIPPIQDFELETIFDTISNFEQDNYRMEVYMLDESMEMLGKIGINDNNKNFIRRIGLGRVGPYVDSNTGYVIGSSEYTRDNLGKTALMYLRVRRVGIVYTFYIAEIRNGKHYEAFVGEYKDTANQFGGRLKYIELFIGNWQDRQRTFRTRINSVKVYELTQQTVDQTPYIAYPGDIITFDHMNDELLLNGEDAKKHKVFGGTYFKLAKGENQLVVHPSNSFNVSMKYRERYR